MAETGLKIDPRSEKLLRKFPKVVSPAIVRAMRLGIKEGEQHGKHYVYHGSGLHHRSGKLAQKLKGKVRITVRGATGNRIEGVLSNTMIYAPVHEYGATIRPINKQWLTIPLDAAKTPAGITRGGAKTFKNTFFLNSKAGNLLLMQKQGKRKIVPLFVLKKQVTIPERPFMKPAAMHAKKRIEYHIPRQIKKALAR